MGTCHTSIPENILGKPEPALVLSQHRETALVEGGAAVRPGRAWGRRCHRSPEPFFSAAYTFREPGLAGRKCRRLVGLAGLWAAARRRFGTAGGPTGRRGVPTDPPRRGAARRGRAQLGARRPRNRPSADGAPATGPMASSCASIDIEDATQHLRDILKLDRPAGGEPGPAAGWARGEPAERAAAARARSSPSPAGPRAFALHALG